MSDPIATLPPADDGRAKRNVLVLATAAALAGAAPIIVFATLPLAAYSILGDNLRQFRSPPSSSARLAARCRQRS